MIDDEPNCANQNIRKRKSPNNTISKTKIREKKLTAKTPINTMTKKKKNRMLNTIVIDLASLQRGADSNPVKRHLKKNKYRA